MIPSCPDPEVDPVIRINLLQDRRVKLAESQPEATPPAEDFGLTEPETPSMGVGFEDYEGTDEVYFTSTKRFNAFTTALIVGGAVVVGLAVWTFIAGNAVDEAREERQALELALEQARADSAELEALEQEHDRLARRVEALKTMARPGGTGERYISLLQAVNEATPQRDVWLSELREREGSVQLKGNTYNHFALADILEGLIDDPQLAAVKQGGAQSIDLEGSRVLQFDFTARLER
jgi:Tfp pilus assembly protein PilN